MAKNWRPFLKENVEYTKDGDHFFYAPLYIYCESNKTVVLKFEQQQNPAGTTEEVCLTAIPGVDDHTTLTTWNSEERTVAVSEIMLCLLHWNYKDARRIWREVSLTLIKKLT